MLAQGHSHSMLDEPVPGLHGLLAHTDRLTTGNLPHRRNSQSILDHMRVLFPRPPYGWARVAHYVTLPQWYAIPQVAVSEGHAGKQWLALDKLEAMLCEAACGERPKSSKCTYLHHLLKSSCKLRQVIANSNNNGQAVPCPLETLFARKYVELGTQGKSQELF
ncbi:hypothetical protein PGT21_006029 [Puccinia graminis f. sp. tritici]|uniref:Uncharacterized protein n=1 Tax=Puccinia graminis f. sp. tritici TaxID=56615 RepID=A0A5B0NMU2_PUCGR|nr:hypothetical protein PGT21_006029 [Puccinia graminis f. sp. tritici]